MGSKKILPLYYAFNAVAVSSTNTYTSTATYIANIDNIGCQVNFVGTSSGTLSVMVSNDNITFDALTFSPILTQPFGSSFHYAIDLNQVPYQYLQFSYANTSGSGTLTISIFGKDVN